MYAHLVLAATTASEKAKDVMVWKINWQFLIFFKVFTPL